jgi:signal transduction histidine kinase
MRESRKPPQRGRTRGTHARPSDRVLPQSRTVRPGGLGAPEAAPVRPPARIWAVRPRSVRAKVVALLMVPVVSMMVLWGLAAVDATQSAWTVNQLRQLDSTEGVSIGNVIGAAEAERTAAVQLLATPGSAQGQSAIARGTLLKIAVATDGAIGVMRADTSADAAALANVGGQLPSRIGALWSAAGALPALRDHVTGRLIDPDTAEAAYTSIVDAGLDAEQALATAQQALLGAAPRAIIDLARTREMIARQDTVMAGAETAGTLDAAGYQQFVGAVYEERDLQDTALPDLPAADRASFLAVTSDAAGRQLAVVQSAVLAAGPGAGVVQAVPPQSWQAASGPVLDDLGLRLEGMVGSQIDGIQPYGLSPFSKSGAALLFGLLAVVVSLLISVRVGRNLVVELVGLRDCALDLAGRRLPRSMARLRAGEKIDLVAEAPLAPLANNEVGQVAGALVAVHRAALEAAVERAEVVGAVSGVFLNLARRSQLLVHRQLALLDLMERRIEDPAELEDLFRLDHLATRMRRHAEGLIILSGAAPGRGWRKPVPLMDVVRAAVSEVEDYARVEVRRLPPVHVSGSSVADLTHLIAELVENATAFSAPHTRVHVHGEALGADFALQIHDEGLGMSEELLAEANRRIGSARQADLLDSDRLGLFVVSRLAHRLGLDVHLTPSPFGGTTALVLVPESVLENPTGAQPEPARALAWSGADAVPDASQVPIQVPVPVPVPVPATPLSADPVLVGVAAGGDRDYGQFGTAAVGGPPRSDQAGPMPRDTRPTDGVTAPPTADSRRGSARRLPRRIRQTHLAPQLREENHADAAADGGGPAGDARPAGPDPSPDQARRTMAEFQRGWRRGRAEHPRPNREGDDA